MPMGGYGCGRSSGVRSFVRAVRELQPDLACVGPAECLPSHCKLLSFGSTICAVPCQMIVCMRCRDESCIVTASISLIQGLV